MGNLYEEVHTDVLLIKEQLKNAEYRITVALPLVIVPENKADLEDVLTDVTDAISFIDRILAR